MVQHWPQNDRSYKNIGPDTISVALAHKSLWDGVSSHFIFCLTSSLEQASRNTKTNVKNALTGIVQLITMIIL